MFGKSGLEEILLAMAYIYIILLLSSLSLLLFIGIIISNNIITFL